MTIIKCPFCGEEIEAESNVCIFCKTKLSEDIEVYSNITAKNIEEIIGKEYYFVRNAITPFSRSTEVKFEHDYLSVTWVLFENRIKYSDINNVKMESKISVGNLFVSAIIAIFAIGFFASGQWLFGIICSLFAIGWFSKLFYIAIYNKSGKKYKVRMKDDEKNKDEFISNLLLMKKYYDNNFFNSKQ